MSGIESGGHDGLADLLESDQLCVEDDLHLVADVLGDAPPHAGDGADRFAHCPLAPTAVHAPHVESGCLDHRYWTSAAGPRAATAATYAATSSASLPVTRSAGMGGFDDSEPRSICSLTSASNEVRSHPSLAGSAYAASRLGPIVPLLFALARVWHPPQLVTNSCWPFWRSASAGEATGFVPSHAGPTSASTATVRRAIGRPTGGKITSRPRRVIPYAIRDRPLSR